MKPRLYVVRQKKDDGYLCVRGRRGETAHRFLLSPLPARLNAALYSNLYVRFNQKALRMLLDKIRNRESGIVLYGIVPPKKTTAPEKLEEISSRQIQRLKSFKIDGLILYDIQDEKSRTPAERPFPFIETLDPFFYSHTYLSSLCIPKIIYKSVGKYSRAELSRFLAQATPENSLTVLVGASSKSQKVTFIVVNSNRTRC
mgnify:CR=1 FL=1